MKAKKIINSKKGSQRTKSTKENDIKTKEAANSGNVKGSSNDKFVKSKVENNFVDSKVEDISSKDLDASVEKIDINSEETDSSGSSDDSEESNSDVKELVESDSDNEDSKEEDSSDENGSKTDSQESSEEASEASESKLENTASEEFELQKNFYTEHTEVMNMSWEEVKQERKLHTIKVKGSDIPNLISKFEHLTLPEAVEKQLNVLKFDKPTPIQAQGLPVALSGRNLVGVAETGSGKTLAYLLPSIQHIKAQPKVKPGQGPIALILAPTRELVQQIKDQLKKLIKGSNISYTCIYGGIPKDIQMKNLQPGVQLVVATPGRLLDLMNSNDINLDRVTYLVLDEADRMLDMGFETQLKNIVTKIQPTRQTMMFSATWPDSVRDLAFTYLNKFIYITVGNLALQTNKAIQQSVKVCDHKQKLDLLTDELTKLNLEDEDTKILIFVATKSMAQKLAEYLNEVTEDPKCAQAIHGDKSQFQRDAALLKFRSSTSKILVATDLASRGLDIPDVKVVINYDMPTKIEDYVHRIGRTGRAGKLGTAISYLTTDDGRLARPLIKLLADAKAPIDPKLKKMSTFKPTTFPQSRADLNTKRTRLDTEDVKPGKFKKTGKTTHISTSTTNTETKSPSKASGNISTRPSITRGATSDRRTARSQRGKSTVNTNKPKSSFQPKTNSSRGGGKPKFNRKN